MTEIVFFGSADFSLPSLQALVNEPSIVVVGVVTREPKPFGRKQELQPTLIEEYARTQQIPVVYSAADSLQFRCTLGALVSYGEILKPAILDHYSNGIFNVHPSLLPAWRGPSPMQASILHGDTMTGVTIMQIATGMDTGPIALQIPYGIRDTATYQELHDELAQQGAAALVQVLLQQQQGELVVHPQSTEGVSYSKIITKGDGALTRYDTAETVLRKLRAYRPWPGVFGVWPGNKRVVVVAAHIKGSDLVFDTVQPAGKQPMPYSAYLAGNPPLQLEELPEA